MLCSQIIKKSNYEDILFTTLLLKWFYSNISLLLLIVKYDCKLFVDTNFEVVSHHSKLLHAPPEQFHTKTHIQGQPNASQMLHLKIAQVAFPRTYVHCLRPNYLEDWLHFKLASFQIIMKLLSIADLSVYWSLNYYNRAYRVSIWCPYACKENGRVHLIRCNTACVVSKQYNCPITYDVALWRIGTT